MSNPKHDFAAVLEHVTWVQRLAHRLCRDAAQAEDVTQESLLSAFREPHRKGSALRHWLVGVVRNQARMARRSSKRRELREAAALPPEPPYSPAELVERVANQRSVVKAVMELPEIYRTALLRRYFEDLRPAEIASIEGVPEATIKTRLRRGLETLRERLADEFHAEGDSKALFAALVPIATVELHRRAMADVTACDRSHASRPSARDGLPQGAPLLSIPAATWLATLGAASVLVWLGVLWLGAQAQSTRHATITRAPVNAARNTTPTVANNINARSASRDPARREAIAVSTASAKARASQLVRIEVLDVFGGAAADIDLAITDFAQPGNQAHRQSTIVGRTDPGGHLAFRQEAEQRQLVAASEGWQTVVPGTVFPFGPTTDVRVVVARTRSVQGVVTNAAGTPIAGAQIVYRTDCDLGARIGWPLDRSTRRQWSVTSDANGVFAFPRVPELPEAALWLEAWDHESALVHTAPRGDTHANCVLAARTAATTWIQGRLLHANGAPAANAVVALGASAVRSDDDGRYRIDAGREPAAERLWAGVLGWAAIAVDRPPLGWHRQINLQFREPLLSISGRVIDDRGNPRAHALVDLADPSHYATLQAPGHWRYEAVPIEEICLGRRTRVRTDALGQFELHGLAHRDYRLVLREPVSLAIATTDPIAAGTHGIERKLPAPSETVYVAGHVVDEHGKGIGGLPVQLQHSPETRGSVAARCVTDDAGRFAFSQAIPRAAQVHVAAGGNYVAIHADLNRFPDPGNLTLILRHAGSFFVQLRDDAAPLADGFRIESFVGTPVMLQCIDGETHFTMARGSFDQGRSPVYRVPIGTHVLVLSRNGAEQRRHVFDVPPGQPVRIDI